MRLSPDQMILWQYGFLKLNGTIVFTWGLMLVLAIGSKLITRKLSTELKRSRWQNLLEIVVTGIEKQIEEVGLPHPEKYIGFLGTLFLFVALAALCTVIPGYEPPTGSLSTTAALALCVFVAVPLFGIEEQGLGGYLRTYVQPTVIMLPFNLISELSRTLALAVRLFGNMMSGAMIIAILLTITPYIFPIVMTALGLLTGMVQAYIFSILAAVYIAAATRTRKPKTECEAAPAPSKPTTAKAPTSAAVPVPGAKAAPYSVELLEKARADADTVLKELGSQLTGLSEAESDTRLKQVGTNEIAREKRQSALMRLLSNVKNPLVLLLQERHRWAALYPRDGEG